MVIGAIALLLLGGGRFDIASRVVDSQRHGISGAKVTLLKTSIEGDAVAAKGETRADGSFSLSTANIGEGQIASSIYVQAAGKGLTYAMLRGNPAPEEIEALPATRVRVTVNDPDGKPAAGIVVVPRLLVEGDQSGPPSYLLFPPELSKEMGAKTDASGQCVLEGLPQKMRVRLDVEDDRYCPLPGLPVLLTDKETNELPPFALKIGATASGKVTRDGKGVPGIKVGAQEGRGNGWGSAVTDAEGNYAMHRLPSGIYNISLDLSDPEKSGVAPAFEGVSISVGASLTGKDFELKPGAKIQGQITDDSGNPVANAYLGIYGPAHPRSSAQVQSVKTDAHGRYVTFVPPGEQFVYAMSGPRGPNKTVIAKLDAPTTVDFKIPKLSQPSVIAGKVVDRDGKPVNGAKVRMFDASGQDYANVETAKTGKDGDFSLMAMGLPVVLRATDGANVNSKLLKITKAGPVEIALDKSGGQIKGLITDESNHPVKGANVKCLEWNEGSGTFVAEVVTGKDGVYEFDGLFPDLQYSIVAIAEGYGTREAPRMTADKLVQVPALKLPKGTSFIEAQVLDENNKPVPNATVEIVQVGYDLRAVTDAQGHFRIDGLPKEEIQVYISAGDAYLSRSMVAGEKGTILVLKQRPKNVEAAPKVKEIVDLPAPVFKTNEWVNSKPMDLKALKGKVVVIDFWAIWCGPCREALPKVKRLAAKYKGNKNVFLMGLHDSTTWELELTKFAKKEGLTYPLAIDKTASDRGFGQTAAQYGIEGIPTVVVIDQKGIVRLRTYSLEDAERMVERLLKVKS